MFYVVFPWTFFITILQVFSIQKVPNLKKVRPISREKAEDDKADLNIYENAIHSECGTTMSTKVELNSELPKSQGTYVSEWKFKVNGKTFQRKFVSNTFFPP